MGEDSNLVKFCNLWAAEYKSKMEMTKPKPKPILGSEVFGETNLNIRWGRDTAFTEGHGIVNRLFLLRKDFEQFLAVLQADNGKNNWKTKLEKELEKARKINESRPSTLQNLLIRDDIDIIVLPEGQIMVFPEGEGSSPQIFDPPLL